MKFLGGASHSTVSINAKRHYILEFRVHEPIAAVGTRLKLVFIILEFNQILSNFDQSYLIYLFSKNYVLYIVEKIVSLLSNSICS